MLDPTRLDQLDRRCSALERDLLHTRQRLSTTRMAAWGLGSAAVLMALMAATSDVSRFETLRAQRLEIIDGEGHVVLAAAGDVHGGRLDTWSSTGANLMRLSANEHGGDLAVWSEVGTNVAGAWATPEGGQVAVWNVDGQRGAAVSAGSAGGSIDVGTSAGEVLVSIASGDSPAMRIGTHLTLSDHGSGAQVRLTAEHDAALTLKSLPGATIVTASGTKGEATVRSGIDGPSLAMTSPDHASLALDIATTGPRIATGDTALSLTPGGMNLSTGETTWMTATSDDGQTSLDLRSPAGAVNLHAGLDAGLTVTGDTAGVRLHGHNTEGVTLASGQNDPVLTTSDQGLSFYASQGAGRVFVGSGEGGRVRLTGPVDGSRPAVEVLSVSGTRVATLTTTGHDTGLLAVADSQGDPVAVLHAQASGRGRLGIIGPGGQAVAGTATDGTPEFALISASGRTLAAIAAVSRGGAINLMNAGGTPIVLAGVTRDGPGGAAAFQNGQGRTVVAVGSTSDDIGRIVVLEEQPDP